MDGKQFKCHKCGSGQAGLIFDGDKYVCGKCLIEERDQLREHRCDGSQTCDRAYQAVKIPEDSKC